MKYQIYSGAGNDFVMINNLSGAIPENEEAELTIKICNEQFKNIDGVIFIDKPKSSGAAVRMNYYNRDGSFGAMCGNGARCTVQYAKDQNIVPGKSFLLEAVDKIYPAEIIDNNVVRITFPEVRDYKLNIHIELGTQLAISKLHWINVGSEHIVVYVDDIIHPKISSINDAEINKWGSMLRFNELFQPKGANVNFLQLSVGNNIRLRTYERGVERETLACGTGIVSGAIISGLLGHVKSPVNVEVQSGETLAVEFKMEGPVIEKISLTGSARKIGQGEI